MISIFWSSLTQMQPSFYPYLYEAISKLIKNDQTTSLIDISQVNLEYIKKKVLTSELIVIDHSIHFSYSYFKVDPVNHSEFILHYKRDLFYYKEVWEFLFTVTNARKVLVLACDLHALEKEPTERIDGLGKKVFIDYISNIDAIAWVYRPEHIPAIDSLTPDRVEDWMSSYGDSYHLGSRIKSKVPTSIELPLCVHESEFYSNKNPAKWDIAILGANYKIRQIALNKLLENGNYKLAPYNKYMGRQARLVTIFGKMFGDQAKKKIKYHMGHFMQEWFINHSDMNFTCGSSLKYFVRKFFEIPAGNSVLLGYTPTYAHDLGFINGKTFVYTEPQDIVDTIEYLNKNKILKEQIRKDGFKMVRELHTATKRAEQFIYALKTLTKNNFKEAKFIESKYTIQ